MTIKVAPPLATSRGAGLMVNGELHGSMLLCRIVSAATSSLHHISSTEMPAPHTHKTHRSHDKLTTPAHCMVRQLPRDRSSLSRPVHPAAQPFYEYGWACVAVTPLPPSAYAEQHAH